ncbi:Cytochrome b561 and DOMON domain-containing protein [Ananas comosus]|uniref:Cytochrome b561 and DOMON domain-containing protein n=1 Tax=Ananas comosus TaxID=4615 RepID=A0A199VYL9_ANACO|nr:Cytochrome b561 and DOMON domain-containing protein [Ananas comosus]
MGLLSLFAPAFALLAVVGAAHAQATDSCDVQLPPALTANYSDLSCRPVWNNFVLRYSQSDDNVLSIVLSAVYATGWVGMGFSKDGMMVGSSAMVGWMGKTGKPHIKRFYLRGQTSSEVVANEGLLTSVDVVPEVHVVQAKIYLAFKLQFSAPVKEQQILFAFGTSIPVNNRLTKHEDKTSMSFDFSTGTSSGSAYPYNLKRTHGGLNIFAWGVLLPIGSIIARYCRQWDPQWFYVHVVFQFIGFLIGLAGVVAGVALYNRLHANVAAHRGLGIFVLVLGILQIISFFVRPDKDSKIRKYWNWYHHWVGRLTLFLAAVNIVLGIHVGGAGMSWKVGYGINLAFLLVAVIVLEVLLWTRWSRKTAPPPVF